jgi:hypothetical protein
MSADAMTPDETHLPSLSPSDRALFNIVAAHRGDLASLAAAAQKTAADIITWASAPAVQAWLTAHDAIVSRLRALQSYSALSIAIDTLVAATKAAQDPVEQRRAAAVLNRAVTARPLTRDPVALPRRSLSPPSTPSAPHPQSRTDEPRSRLARTEPVIRPAPPQRATPPASSTPAAHSTAPPAAFISPRAHPPDPALFLSPFDQPRRRARSPAALVAAAGGPAP